MEVEFTLLKNLEVLYDRNPLQLEALLRYGALAANTDLSILTGNKMPRFDSNVREDKSLRGRTGLYATQSVIYSDSVQVILSDGSEMAMDVSNRGMGIRPVMKSKELVKMAQHYVKPGINGTQVLEYGEYPQYVVNEDLSCILESLYISDSLARTGKTYTFDGRKYDETLAAFEPVEYAEYVIDGKKYVRVLANPYDEYGCKLSNGVWYQRGDGVWLAVSPVKWLVDEKSESLIAMNCLLSGIRFNDPCKGYNGNVKETEMYNYMNTIMKKDLFDVSRIMKKGMREVPKTLKKEKNS